MTYEMVFRYCCASLTVSTERISCMNWNIAAPACSPNSHSFPLVLEKCFIYRFESINSVPSIHSLLQSWAARGPWATSVSLGSLDFLSVHILLPILPLFSPFICVSPPSAFGCLCVTLLSSLSSFSIFVFSRSGQEDYRSRLSGECFQDLVCPEKCRCEGTVVDCSNLKLTRIPPHIPEHTTDL